MISCCLIFSYFFFLLLFRLRDGELVDPNQGRLEGGNAEQTALLIKDASRNDIGSYTCELENGIGKGLSENDIDVDIYCKFSVILFCFTFILNFYSKMFQRWN